MNTVASQITPDDVDAGAYTDVSMVEYHDGPGISKSGLDKIAQSPRHYWNAYLNPESVQAEPTPAQLLGSAAHCWILEPDEFGQRYAVRPEGIDRRTKDGKARWSEFETEATGKEIITAEQYEHVMRMGEAVRDKDKAAAMLSRGDPEVTAFWRDDETGALCKCRPDWVSTAGFVVDLKTTADASPKSFARTATNFRYHVSSAFSMDGMRAATGRRLAAYAFLVVESTPPYGVALYVLDDLSQERGHELYRRDLTRYAECLANDHWPDYSPDVETLMLPQYAFYD